MEGLIILAIWAMINAFIKDANRKNKEGKTRTITSQPKRKNVFSTFMDELEKEMQGQKEKQRPERPAQPERYSQPARPTQPSMASDRPARPEPSMVSDLPKPKAPPKPVGLEIDYIGGDEEIGGINEARISKVSKNNLDLDIKRDLLKGIIYSEILSEPKSIRNIKRVY